MNTPYKNSQVNSEKKMFRYVCGSQNDWPWMKSQKLALPLVLIQNHCLIRFNISLTSIMILALTVTEKINISKFSHTNALGIKFDLAVM